jgi:ABC-2 type transport system permease protein
MNKIWLIIKREYLTKVKKKSFLVMTILAPFIFGGIGTLMVLVAKTDTTVHDILIVDQKGWILEEEFANPADINTKRGRFIDDENTHFFCQKSPVVVEDELKSNKYTIIVNVDSGSYEDGICKVFFKNAPSLAVQNRVQEDIESSIEKWRVARAGIDFNKYQGIKVIAQMQMVNIQDANRDEKIYMRAAIGFGTALIIYIFILIYGLQVMRGVMEEKTNRIVEVIISSVKPFQLMMGKIIGIGLVGITQFLIWIILTGIFGSIGISSVLGDMTMKEFNEMSDKMATSGVALNAAEMEKAKVDPQILELIYTTPWLDIAISFLFFFAAGYLLYASMFAAIGAAVDQESDTQQFQIPVTMPLIFGYIISIMMIQNPEGGLGTAFSIVPFTAPIVMMVKTAIGVELWLRLLSMTVLIGTFLGITWLAARIYRVGILMYGKKPSYKELWKWIRYSG